MPPAAEDDDYDFSAPQVPLPELAQVLFTKKVFDRFGATESHHIGKHCHACFLGGPYGNSYNLDPECEI